MIFTPVTACDVNFYDACKVKSVIESQQAKKSKSQPELTKCLQLSSIISDNGFDVFDDFDLALNRDYGDYSCSVVFNQNYFERLNTLGKFLSGFDFAELFVKCAF